MLSERPRAGHVSAAKLCLTRSGASRSRAAAPQAASTCRRPGARGPRRPAEAQRAREGAAVTPPTPAGGKNLQEPTSPHPGRAAFSLLLPQSTKVKWGVKRTALRAHPTRRGVLLRRLSLRRLALVGICPRRPGPQARSLPPAGAVCALCGTSRRAGAKAFRPPADEGRWPDFDRRGSGPCSSVGAAALTTSPARRSGTARTSVPAASIRRCSSTR